VEVLSSGLAGEDLRNIPNHPGGAEHQVSSAPSCRIFEMWYPHGPDHSIFFEVTMKAVNDLYKEGYFNRSSIQQLRSVGRRISTKIRSITNIQYL
jgi:hypothetical protein